MMFQSESILTLSLTHFQPMFYFYTPFQWDYRSATLVQNGLITKELVGLKH